LTSVFSNSSIFMLRLCLRWPVVVIVNVSLLAATSRMTGGASQPRSSSLMRGWLIGGLGSPLGPPVPFCRGKLRSEPLTLCGGDGYGNGGDRLLMSTPLIGAAALGGVVESLDVWLTWLIICCAMRSGLSPRSEEESAGGDDFLICCC
jgi:hypothetical protein